MLDTLKTAASGWIAQLFIALLVLSFAVWGVADVFTGFRGDTVAQVGGQDVTVYEFQRRIDLATRQLSRSLGQQITMEQAQQFGVTDQILGRLLNEATLDHAATELGLGISNPMLGRRIATDPELIGPGGTFDRGFLTEIARQQGLSEGDLVLERKAAYLRDQLGQALVGGVVAPDAYMQAIHAYRNEERDIRYAVLHAPPASDIADPSDSELSAYFEANTATWRAPEYRSVSYFVLSPAEIAEEGEVSDEDARQLYDRQPQRFTTPERRRIEQVVFPDRAEAVRAAQALSAGGSFEALLAERGLTSQDVDLGLVARGGIVDPAVAEAAFGLAEGAASPVVDGRFGPVIVHVSRIEPEIVTSFDGAKADLKREIAETRAVAAISDLHDAIEDERAGGARLAEVAAKYDLAMVALPAVDAAGNGTSGDELAGLPDGLVAAAYESDVGLENNPIQPSSDTFVWYEVTGITQPRERDLAEVREQALAAWKDDQRQKRLEAAAAQFRDAVERGNPFVDVAASSGSLEVRTREGLTRGTRPEGDLSTAAILAAFSNPKGAVAVAPGADDMARAVMLIEDVATPPFVPGGTDLAADRQQATQQYVGDLLGLYVAQVQNNTDMRFNQIALQQALGIAPN